MKGDVHTLWKMLQPCKLVQILHPRGVSPIPKISLRRFF
nr:MAG TPA: LYSOZYME, CALCIUM-BINDING.9A [Caudoviricetes sp.]